MKLINAYFDEKNGISYATVQHNINGIKRRFEGIAKLHPEDNKSKFTGCRYAETRAQIKALKAERESLIKKCEECRKFVKACSQYKNWDKESPTAKAIYKQLNKRIKAINELTNRINHLQWDLNIAIKQQDMFNKKLTSKGFRAETAIIDEAVSEDIKAEIDNLS
jgi:predicted RNase H-like nuclease (RuvC/YqgF family)